MPDELEGTRRLLPVGSVVRLRDGGDSLVMVMGFEPEVDDVVADYLGVPYPMGLVSDDAALVFDVDAVTEVLHRGFWDDEGEAAVAAVNRFRAVAADTERRLQELVDSLDAEHYMELREHYTFGRFDEEPEPDLLDDEFDVLDGEAHWALDADVEMASNPIDLDDNDFDDFEDADEPDFLDDVADEPEPELLGL